MTDESRSIKAFALGPGITRAADVIGGFLLTLVVFNHWSCGVVGRGKRRKDVLQIYFAAHFRRATSTAHSVRRRQPSTHAVPLSRCAARKARAVAESNCQAVQTPLS